MDVGSSEVVAEVVASTAGSLGPVIQSGPEGLYWPGPHSGKDCLPKNPEPALAAVPSCHRRQSFPIAGNGSRHEDKPRSIVMVAAHLSEPSGRAISASSACQAMSSFPDLGQSPLHVHGLYVAADHDWFPGNPDIGDLPG